MVRQRAKHWVDYPVTARREGARRNAESQGDVDVISDGRPRHGAIAILRVEAAERVPDDAAANLVDLPMKFNGALWVTVTLVAERVPAL